MGKYPATMTDMTLLIAYVAPMLGVTGAAWRLSSKLTQVQLELRQIKAENQRLAADIRSLQTLMGVLVDSRRPAR